MPIAPASLATSRTDVPLICPTLVPGGTNPQDLLRQLADIHAHALMLRGALSVLAMVQKDYPETTASGRNVRWDVSVERFEQAMADVQRIIRQTDNAWHMVNQQHQLLDPDYGDNAHA